MWIKTLKFLIIFGILSAIFGTATIGYTLWYFNIGLPNYDALKSYSPPTVTRVHAGDGKMIAEYAEQRRVYVPIDNIPQRIVQAFIAAEDKDFYNHPGVDAFAILRASIQNVRRLIQGGRPLGASTITQQVAKNFLLSNELSVSRKIKEALLALRIERALSKDSILDLYLNEIYLGNGAYGVAAAALTYFDLSLGDLSIAEAAFLAALPKAPSNYNPWRNNTQAKARRDWIIGRMAEIGFINEAEALRAQQTPLEPKAASGSDVMDARYFVEHVRQELARDFGLKAVNRGGLSVRTTLDTTMQRMAYDALTSGLITYDRRHGYRGPLRQVPSDTLSAWTQSFAAMPKITFPRPDWQRAIVLEAGAEYAKLGLENGNSAVIVLSGIKWARKFISDTKRGGSVKSVDQVLAVGDVVIVAPQPPETEKITAKEPDTQETTARAAVVLPELPRFSLQQYPEINGGIIALDPFTGRILAMQGGLEYAQSEYNRTTQAARQPGSAFKPFVYLAALETGFTPATRILDAPFVLDQGEGKPKWKPANYSEEFYGLSPMRLGIEKSRNLMTVRLAQQVGMDSIADIAKRFAIADDLPRQLAVSLGAHEVTLLDLTRAYAQIVNGGRSITPTAIDRVQDRFGNALFLHDTRRCDGCDFRDPSSLPVLNNTAPQLTSPEHAYQLTSMLQGVVKRGTGRSISTVDYPLAGKTGTTNDSIDAWFVGFSPNLAVGVYAGFDQPRSLGRHPAGYQETGASIAAPIFRDFMAAALAGTTKVPFRVPDNVQFIKIDPKTGQRARAGSSSWIEEAFVVGTSPEQNNVVIRNPTAQDSAKSRQNQTLELY